MSTSNEEKKPGRSFAELVESGEYAAWLTKPEVQKMKKELDEVHLQTLVAMMQEEAPKKIEAKKAQ